MDLITGLETRKSCRAFLPRPVPREAVQKILAAAGKSPSYMNTQPWETAVVAGRKLEELGQMLYKLAETGTPSSADWPAPKSWPPDLKSRSDENNARRFALLGIPREDEKGKKQFRLGNYKFYGAPCSIFILMDKSLANWSAFDLGAYTLSICLAAHSLGLGSCIQASPANYPQEIRGLLGIAESKAIVLNIAIGYADEKARIYPFQSLRVPPDTYVKWYE